MTLTCPFDAAEGIDARRATRAVQRESQRARLLWAIGREIADKGYPGATIVAICTRAHVSARTFYDYYDNKEELFLAAYETGAEFVESLIAERIATSESWPGKVLALVEGPLEAYARDPACARGLFAGALTAGPRVLDARSRVHDRWALVARQVFDAARAADPAVAAVTPTLDAEMSYALVAASEAIVRRALEDPTDAGLGALLPAKLSLTTSIAGLPLPTLRSIAAQPGDRPGLTELIDILAPAS